MKALPLSLLALITLSGATVAAPNATVTPLLSAAGESQILPFKKAVHGPRRSLSATWKMRFKTGEGAAFVLLDSNKYVSSTVNFKNWDEPNLPDSFAIAFDAVNPKEENPFNPNGNIYDRPQHEISLHWNGLEIANRVSTADFRGDDWHQIDIRLNYVVGGAEISVGIDGQFTYDKYLVPGLQPIESRAILGARATDGGGEAEIKELDIHYGKRAEVTPPLSIRALDRRVVKIGVPTQSNMVHFPAFTDQYGRIVLTLSLTAPEGGFDPWDRRAAIYLYDEKGERFELLRFITLYRRGYTWRVDVSDFRPLLMGARKIEAWCETYGPGYAVTADFDFFPGPAPLKAYKIRNLWTGDPEIGNPSKPPSAFWKPIPLNRDGADAMKLRFTVTGHGMSPNTNNAGEFMPLGRTVTLNGREWKNTLWKTDNYLNPCRPQGGTWKYDRAGWAPGDVVLPWEVDATPALKPRATANLQYDIAPYVNTSRVDSFPPSHWFESQVVYYRRSP